MKRDGLIWALIALVVILFSATAYAISKEHEVAIQATRALCSLRQGYEGQLKNTKDYLRKHPNGAPALHLSAADLQRSISSLQKQVNDLGDVKCSS